MLSLFFFPSSASPKFQRSDSFFALLSLCPSPCTYVLSPVSFGENSVGKLRELENFIRKLKCKKSDVCVWDEVSGKGITVHIFSHPYSVSLNFSFKIERTEAESCMIRTPLLFVCVVGFVYKTQATLVTNWVPVIDSNVIFKNTSRIYLATPNEQLLIRLHSYWTVSGTE